METRPLYFIAVRHPEAYDSPEDGDGKLTPLGRDQSKALEGFVNNLREELVKDSDNLRAWEITSSAFSSVFQRSFQTTREMSSLKDSVVIALGSLNDTSPSLESARKAFSSIMQYYRGEKIVVVTCHGSMPGMLANAAYAHFVFPLKEGNLAKDANLNPYYACGYMLDLEKSKVIEIDVGLKVAEAQPK